MKLGGFIACVAVGWSGLPVDAQPRQGEPQRQANTQEAPAENSAPPLRIEIIESQAKAEARNGREEKSYQREIDDLVAQQGMQKSADAMSGFALWQTWLVGIGTFLLLATVVLARQANKGFAASAERQLRAYVAQNGSDLSSKDGPWVVVVFVKNTGLTPARNVSYRLSVDIRSWDTTDFSEYKPETGTGVMGPGIEWRITPAFDGNDLAERGKKIRDAKRALCVFGTITYDDAFEARRITTIRLRKQVTDLWTKGPFEAFPEGNDMT